MHYYLNHYSTPNYLLQITRESVVLDVTLLTNFSDAVKDLHPAATTEVIARVHGVLVAKIYNARSNEFLRT